MIGRILRFFRPDREQPPSAPPPPSRPPQPEYEKDWAVGDRAQCIIVPGGTWSSVDTHEPARGPRPGAVLRVVYLYRDELSVWLCFSGFPGVSYPAGHFRKLRPCSTDFREQLRNRLPSHAPKRPLRVPAPKAIPELVP